MGEWTGRTAADIAAAVRGGKATAVQVVREHLDRIAALDGGLGAFVRVRPERALAEAAEVDARADRADLPLAGVPVAIKDNVPVAGEPMRAGSAATDDVPRPADHPVVARLRAAGAVVVGLTNLPELGIYPFTDNGYGIARNPWDTARTAGGSSGGSAAAVAAGLVPVAHGNDGAGSIRIPAANCGLFGIKPGTGVVPAELGADSWDAMAENGPLATTVEDAALVLSVMAGDPSLAAPGPADGLRVALSVRPPVAGVAVRADLRAAVREAGKALVAGGHSVHRDDPDYPVWAGLAVMARWLVLPGAEAEALLGDPRLEPRTRRHARAGRAAARVRPPRPDDRARFQEAVAPLFDRHDVLVMPTLARRAPRARRNDSSWLRSIALSAAYAPMTAAWNLAGYPAATVPMGIGASGLPLSVQLVAAPGGEASLLALAAELERTRPWPRHAPAFTP
ncbi:amidase [Actinomadura parmotrematis]|uniref:Amidase n=1 Tax=Actinomadura parmotrematis TaxID=2864039 RepID=A0ABS7G0S4_9ACTN|nr:amidase family protein [Actinomadura parmotrematis]MBW8485469.1 amidase [Actinomadura parmotrematis]